MGFEERKVVVDPSTVGKGIFTNINGEFGEVIVNLRGNEISVYYIGSGHTDSVTL